MSTSSATSLNPSPSSSSASYLTDDLKNQAHQTSGATTAQGLSLSGSLTLDASDIGAGAVASQLSSFSQGQDITFGADNCLPAAS
ncbi:MAG: hypothetical protein K2W99_06520, partial [Chthoniobacterales bacterium]|nr:hypothetical protein [Chthoniobacterales bacterium]